MGYSANRYLSFPGGSRIWRRERILSRRLTEKGGASSLLSAGGERGSVMLVGMENGGRVAGDEENSRALKKVTRGLKADSWDMAAQC